MKKRSVIGLTATVLGLVVVCSAFAVSTWMLHGRNKQHRLTLDNIYKMNIYSLTDSAANMEVNMSKLMVSADKKEGEALAADTYRHSMNALHALESLPVDYRETFLTVKFLNQLGDFCNSYINSDDGTVFEEQLDDLYQNCLYFRQNVLSLNPEKPILLDRGIMKIGFDQTNKKNHTEYSSMIYDGPFSDGANKREFLGLCGCEEISGDEAVKIAEEIFDFLNLRSLTLAGKSDLPVAYNLEGKTKGGEVLIGVSVCGGKIVTVTAMDGGAEVNKSEDFYKEKAVFYGEKCGYGRLTPVWYNESGDTVFVNLAPTVDGVICYPDLVKVKLSGSGELCGLEATGHCACCHKRDLSYTVSEESALKKVSKKINVKSSRLALIPKAGKEILTYEFSGDYNGVDYFVYVDANTCKQINILRTVNNNQGKLVI